MFTAPYTFEYHLISDFLISKQREDIFFIAKGNVDEGALELSIINKFKMTEIDVGDGT